MLEVLGFDSSIMIAVLIAFVIFLLCSLPHFSVFQQNLRYINTEICRTSGREQRYWMRKRRKLWLSLLPFVKYKPN